ncbi:MAG: PilZ domain-containing protein [Phycisphaerae bacterium]|nr:PilZ domain-containing protein [Phycisphaerae bacterium]
MTDMQKADRRRHHRRPLSAGVQFHHEPSAGDYPARAVDISDSGMLMYVPVSAPVKPGHPVRVTIHLAHRRPDNGLGDLDDTPRPARIVRVQREGLMITGKLAVGVEFVQG